VVSFKTASHDGFSVINTIFYVINRKFLPGTAFVAITGILIGYF
jgi:hypothetical protein